MTSSPEIDTALRFLRSESLSSVLQNEIEHRILTGALKPGQRVNENALSNELGVSRGPIREACCGLAKTGLLTTVVNRGFFVRQVTRKEAIDVYEVRASLMRLAGAALACQVTRAQLDALRVLVDRMDKAETQRDFDTFYALNERFHDSIVEFAGNERLHAICKGLAKELHLYRSRSLLSGGGFGISNQEHKDILAALMSGDAEKAGAALEAHIQAGKRRFLAATEPDDDETKISSKNGAPA
jgi:DNA-binding GntR family transcriptional regulator